MTKPRTYDQPLFPDMTPPGDDTKPRPQADIDRQIANIARIADLREVEVVDVASEAAIDQGFPHETPRFGLPRPSAKQLQEAEAALDNDRSSSDVNPSSQGGRFLTTEERERALAGVEEIRRLITQLHSDPNRPKFPRI